MPIRTMNDASLNSSNNVNSVGIFNDNIIINSKLME